MLRWTLVAQDDLYRVLTFLHRVHPPAVPFANRRILEAVGVLTRQPSIGMPRQGEPNDRKLIIPFGRSAYVLHDKRDGDDIVILRLWHGRERRPL
jgi:plasmid stabilization system protein ParE